MSNAPQPYVNRFGITSLVEVNGVAQTSRPTVNLIGNITGSDDATDQACDITIGAGGAAVYAGPTKGMHDANYAAPSVHGLAHIACDAQFSADRTLTMPASPNVGDQVDWSDECVTVGGALLNHNLIVNGGGLQVMAGGTDLTGGIALAATYTATKNAWPPGSVFSMRCSLLSDGVTKFWKVM